MAGKTLKALNKIDLRRGEQKVETIATPFLINIINQNITKLCEQQGKVVYNICEIFTVEGGVNMLFSKGRDNELEQSTIEQYIQQFMKGETKDIPVWLLAQLDKLTDIRQVSDESDKYIELLTTATQSGIWEAKVSNFNFFSSQTAFRWLPSSRNLLGYLNSSKLPDHVSSFDMLLNAEDKQQMEREVRQFYNLVKVESHIKFNIISK